MDLLHACSISKGLLKEILSSIQDAIIVTDLEGRILFVSPVVEKLLGFIPDELIGKDLSVIFTPEDLDNLYPNLLHMARKNGHFEGELMLIRKNQTRFFASMVFRPYLDPGQNKTMNIVCIRNIDKEKQLIKAFSESNYEDLVQIADGIAHELRNPLMGIGGFVNRLLKSSRVIHDHEKYYGYIVNNLKKIEELVKKVEFFASLPRPCFVEESVREVIENALQPYRQQMKELKIDLTISLEETTFFMDADLVGQAFSILIQNALEALNEGGKISVHSETKDNQCKIHVTDNGSGIPPKDIPYIFHPFFSTKSRGIGISLAVVKRIMNIHGGSVEVTSKQGKGTTFLLMFPV